MDGYASPSGIGRHDGMKTFLRETRFRRRIPPQRRFRFPDLWTCNQSPVPE